jgi:hypothetical protein
MNQPSHPSGGYDTLRLQHNPFIAIPPVHTYEIELRPLFSARDAEVTRICRLAGQPTAVFVNAPYGGGKTVVVLEALSRLREQGTITVYAQFDRAKGFRQSLRDGIVASGVGVAEGDLLTEIRAAVRQTRRGGGRIVLALDDLDRAGDVVEVLQVTHDVRDFLSDGASVVVTGQPFGVTYDLHTSAGGIFHEVMVPEFSASDFHEMLVKYLKSAHAKGDLPDTHPFDTDTARFVCHEIAEAKLTPRLFNFAMGELLDLAASGDATEITLGFALQRWAMLVRRVVGSVTPLQARHLQIILRAEQVSEDTPQAINELGESKLAEYPEVREGILRPLLERNLIQVRMVEGKESFRLTPHVATTVDELFGAVKSLPIPFGELVAALDKCLTTTDKHEKGELLEQFTAKFFSHVLGFQIPDDGIRLRTESEELDVVVEILGFWHHTRYENLTICECKNWTHPVSWDELASFREKLMARGCKFGIFIALRGVTEGFREKMKAYLRDGVVIALLTETELRRLEQKIQPAIILQDAYYTTIKYEGEAGP